MTDLLHRLREGEGADRSLDDEISRRFNYWHEPGDFRNSPVFTESLDACIALAEKVAPGMSVWLLRRTIETLQGQHSHNPVVDPTLLPRNFLIALITAKETEHDR